MIWATDWKNKKKYKLWGCFLFLGWIYRKWNYNLYGNRFS